MCRWLQGRCMPACSTICEGRLLETAPHATWAKQKSWRWWIVRLCQLCACSSQSFWWVFSGGGQIWNWFTNLRICFHEVWNNTLLFIMTGMARDGLDSRALCRTESRCLHFMLNGKWKARLFLCRNKLRITCITLLNLCNEVEEMKRY